MTAATRHRSWGLDAPRDDAWEARGLCAPDPTLWTESVDRGSIAAAKATCRRCPVLDQCAQDTAGYPFRGVTVAGVYYDTSGQVSRA